MASEEANTALHSTVHGAGRAMSRTQARGKINYKTNQVIAPGLVSWEMMMEWIGRLGVAMAGENEHDPFKD